MVIVTGVLIIKFSLHSNPTFEKVISTTFIGFGGINIIIDFYRKHTSK